MQLHVFLDVTPETSWTVDYESAKSCNKVLEEQLKLRKKALDNPLKVDDTLTNYGLSLFPFMVRNDSGTSPSHRRPISPPLNPLPTASDHTPSLVLRLVEPLQTGKGCYGQVWKCQAQYLAPLPYWKGMWLADFYCPIDWVARREAKASELLEDLQGSFFPGFMS
ncbi:hypothetical protein JAAARDRAFT_208363 [Jaapia argillacea MUCL 33604]|uniref:Uncharacterized protein n=1 Tax=Jaapia argillacea MUCL 33604 TaxID=933084 RepID=A0A067PN23_9AGAM|nr:hypothetical protein JAAARDRAFT_208363 [Jaapia argillacea MUCL 33604]